MVRTIDHGDGSFPPDDFTGEWEVCWPNGQTKWVAHLVNGEIQGQVQCFWDNGTVAQKCVPSDIDGEMHVVNFNEAGRKTSEGLTNLNGNHGTWTYYHENGETSSTSEWTNGVQHGRQIDYDVDGSIEADGDYVEGEPYNRTFLIFDPWSSSGSTSNQLEFRRYINGKVTEP